MEGQEYNEDDNTQQTNEVDPNPEEVQKKVLIPYEVTREDLEEALLGLA